METTRTKISFARKTQSAMHIAHIILCLVGSVCLVVATVGYLKTSKAANQGIAQIASNTDGVKDATAAATGSLKQATSLMSTLQNTLVVTQPVITKAGSALDKYGAVADTTKLAVLAMYRPCKTHNTRDSAFFTNMYSEGSVMPCGLVPDIAQSLGTVRGAFGEVEKAAKHENANLGRLDAQEEILFSRFDSLLDSYTNVANDLHKGMNSTEFKNTSAHIEKITGFGADIMGHGASVAAFADKQITGPKTFMDHVRTYGGDGLDIGAFLARRWR